MQLNPSTSVSTKSVPAIPQSLTGKLRCIHCKSSNTSLIVESTVLKCDGCKATYPLQNGKFPNFLTEEENAKIQKEISFWETHFSDNDYSPESESSYQHLIDLLGTSGQKEALEIGCGSAALLRRLPATLKVGLEPVGCLLDNAIGSFAGVIGVATNLPFKEASFDLVYFKDSLHHVEEKYSAFVEAVRVLKPGGKLVVIEPNALHPQRRAISNPKSIFRKMKFFTQMIGPVESFQKPDELLEWAKLTNLKIEGVQFFSPKYDKSNFRQRLQKCYSTVLKPVLATKYLLPEYFISFTKSPAANA